MPAVTLTPNVFLRVMQRAVADPGTQPLYPSDIQLSPAFNKDFAAAQQAARRGNPVPLARIDAAARCAYAAIVVNWRSHVGPTQLDGFQQHRGVGHRVPGPGGGQRRLRGRQQRRRGRLLGGVRRRDRPDAERRPAQLPADVPRRRDPAGQALLVGHRVPPAHHRWCPTWRASTWSPATRRAWSTTRTARSRSTWRRPGPPARRWRTGCRCPADCSVVLLRVYGPTGNTASPTYAPPAITTAR